MLKLIGLTTLLCSTLHQFPEVAALSRDHLRDARSHKPQKLEGGVFKRVFHGEIWKEHEQFWNSTAGIKLPEIAAMIEETLVEVWFKLGCLVGLQAVSFSLYPSCFFFIVSAWLQYIILSKELFLCSSHSIFQWNPETGILEVSSALSRNWEMERHFWWKPLERSSHRFTSRRKKTRFNDDVDQFNVQTEGFETDSHGFLQNSIQTGLVKMFFHRSDSSLPF